jgi:hypothetical protein
MLYATTGRTPWTLLDLSLGGKEYRYTDSPQPLAVTDSTGRTYAYRPGLAALALERSIGRLASVSCQLDEHPGTPWARLFMQGVIIDRAEAIIRRWFDGTILEDSEVYLRGEVTSPAWGDDTEPLTFNVAQTFAELGVYPLPSMAVGAETWPVTATSYDPACEGVTYPLVIGRPNGKIGRAHV